MEVSLEGEVNEEGESDIWKSGYLYKGVVSAEKVDVGYRKKGSRLNEELKSRRETGCR